MGSVSFPQVFLSHTANRPLPSLFPHILTLLIRFSGLTSGLFLSPYLWSLSCCQDLFLSPSLLCSPSLSTLCLAGGGTVLPCAGVTLSSISDAQGRCCSLTVNCCTSPGRLQEFARFGFNQYWHSLETFLKVIVHVYNYPMLCDCHVFEVLFLAIVFPFENRQSFY